MSCLHTIKGSPDSNLLKSCLRLAAAGDGILFIEDGVYHCSAVAALGIVHDSIKIYGLREDLLARATLAKALARVDVIDTNRFVELCCEHDKVMSWF